MKKNGSLILVLLVVFTSTLKGQVKDTSDYCAICKDHVHTVYYPYTKKFKKEIPFLVGSAVIVGAEFLVAGANKTKNYTEEELTTHPLDKNSINSFDRSAADNWSPGASTTSDYVLFGISVLPAAFLLEHHERRDILSLGAITLEVFAFNFGVTNIVKNLVNRPRPFVYNNTGAVPMSTRTGVDSRTSFFSGHASHTAAATFLFAKVISDYHPNMKPGLKTGMWIFAAAVPAVNGYLRVQAGKHFPSDVIAGYAVGAASGWLIPHLHKRKNAGKDKVELGFLPYQDGMALNLRMKL